MHICKECNKTENETKWPLTRGKIVGNYCGKCRYQRYKESMKGYYRDRYASDSGFRKSEREKGRRISKQRRINGKDKEYLQSTPRRFLYAKTRRYLGRGHDVSITLDDLCRLWENQKGECALTGLPMTTQFYCMYSVSIDRIDSANKSYSLNNIQLVCKAINLAKNNHTNEEMVAFIQSIKSS